MITAFRCAATGIIDCIHRERHMKVHLVAACGAFGLAWQYELHGIELGVLFLTIAGVLTAELFNTALEAVVDRISPEFHPLAKLAKDIAAGAVLIQAIAALGVGYVLFGDKLLK
ncbi:diacylglycerol kinase family protein [Sporomusa acidovorans]|nr:diacylglycerol kinase family protein [Sporomusa acidovorans]